MSRLSCFVYRSYVIVVCILPKSDLLLFKGLLKFKLVLSEKREHKLSVEYLYGQLMSPLFCPFKNNENMLWTLVTFIGFSVFCIELPRPPRWYLSSTSHPWFIIFSSWVMVLFSLWFVELSEWFIQAYFSCDEKTCYHLPTWFHEKNDFFLANILSNKILFWPIDSKRNS